MLDVIYARTLAELVRKANDKHLQKEDMVKVGIKDEMCFILYFTKD